MMDEITIRMKAVELAAAHSHDFDDQMAMAEKISDFILWGSREPASQPGESEDAGNERRDEARHPIFSKDITNMIENWAWVLETFKKQQNP